MKEPQGTQEPQGSQGEPQSSEGAQQGLIVMRSDSDMPEMTAEEMMQLKDQMNKVDSANYCVIFIFISHKYREQ